MSESKPKPNLHDVLMTPAFGIQWEAPGEITSDAVMGIGRWKFRGPVRGSAVVIFPDLVQVLCCRFTRANWRVLAYLDLESNWVDLAQPGDPEFNPGT